MADLGKLQITGIRLQSCLGCGAGFVESCLCVSSVLSCTETKGPWIHLSLANKVKYSRVCSINLESAKKIKAVFNETKENLNEGLQLPENLEVFTESHAQKPQLQMGNFYSHPTKLKQSLFC